MIKWKGVKIADAGFLINLDEREDRLILSQNELQKNEITNVERFSAIKILEDSDEGWIIRGCTHSHLEIFKKQIENNWERVIIFEDDFYFEICSDNKQYEFGVSEIENINKSNFDCLFLGVRLTEQSEMFTDNLIIPKNILQTHSYIISLNFAKFIVDNFNYLDKNSLVYGEQIDSFFSTLTSKKHWRMNSELKDTKIFIENNFKIYVHNPVLFNQRPGFSNVTNRLETFNISNCKANKSNYPKL